VATWNPWTLADIECLEKVQKRAIAMVSRLGSGSYEARLKERWDKTDIVETYKKLTKISNVDKSTWFTRNAAAEGSLMTRLAVDPPSLRTLPTRLELRQNFSPAEYLVDR